MAKEQGRDVDLAVRVREENREARLRYALSLHNASDALALLEGQEDIERLIEMVDHPSRGPKSARSAAR